MKKYILLVTILISILAFFFFKNTKNDKSDNLKKSLVVSKRVIDSEEDIRDEKNLSSIIQKKSEDLFLNISGEKFGIIFDEQFENSEGLGEMITDDLQLLFGHMEKATVTRRDIERYYLHQGKKTMIDGFVVFDGKGRFFPHILTDDFGLMSGDKIVLPQALLEAYEEAINRKKRHQKEYHLLKQTIHDLNNLTSSQRSVEDWVFMKGASEDVKNAFAEYSSAEFRDAFARGIYKDPSLLNVSFIEDEKSPLDGLLMANIYLERGGVLTNRVPPLVFSEGSWKIYIQ